MTDIATLLDQYAALDPERRAEVDAYVATHPVHAEAHAEARAFAALLDAAAPEVGPLDVARLAVDERMGLDTPDADAIRAALAADPSLAAEADRIGDRLDAFAAEGEDPVRQFERLTGTRLPAEPPLHVAPTPAAATPAADRPAAVGDRAVRRRVPRWLTAAAAVLVVGYGALAVMSVTSLSERDRIAELGDLAAYEPSTLRGAPAEALADRLDTALDGVEAARRTTLGLFPRYDASALAAVAGELRAIVAAADPSTAVSQEARFALGRILYRQGEDLEAARVLGSLVREGSYRGAEARRVLDAIRVGA